MEKQLLETHLPYLDKDVRILKLLLRIYCVGHVPHDNRLNDVVFCKLHNLELLNKVCVFLHHQVAIIAWSVNVCKML